MPGPDGPESLVHLRRLRYQDLLLVRGAPTPGPRTPDRDHPDGYVTVLTAPRLEDIAASPEWTATVVGSLGRRPEEPTG